MRKLTLFFFSLMLLNRSQAQSFEAVKDRTGKKAAEGVCNRQPAEGRLN